MRWRSWLTHCSKIREVAGSILYDIKWIFHWLNPSDRTMTLIEMSKRGTSSGVKAVGVNNHSTCMCRLCRNPENPKLLQPSGLIQVCPEIALPLLRPVTVFPPIKYSRIRPASWSSGHSLWLLIMRSRVRFPALPCEFSLMGGEFPRWPWSG